MDRRFRAEGWGPVWAALGARLALLGLMLRTQGSSGLFATDTESYIEPGRALLHGHFGWPVAEINRTPGYPLFAVLTGMWGDHPVWTAMAQIAVACVSTWLVMRIAGQISGSQKASTAAGYLYAFEPLAMMSACAIVPDSIYVALLLAMTTVLVEYVGQTPIRPRALAGTRQQTPLRPRALAWAAVWLAASAYVRPASYYLPIFLAGYLLVLLRELRLGQRCRAVAVFGLISLSLLGIWQLRNRVVAGYSGFSSIAEKNLYYYLAAGVRAKVQHRGFGEMQKELGWHDEARYLARHPEQVSWTQAQRFAFMKRDAVHTIASHPVVYARLHANGMGVVLFAPPATDFLRLVNLYPEQGGLLNQAVDAGPVRTLVWIVAHRPGVFFVMVAMWLQLLAYYAWAVRGAMRGLAQGQAAAAGLLLWIGLYFVLISGGPQAVARYRLPLVPLICVLGGAGIAWRANGGAPVLQDAGQRYN